MSAVIIPVARLREVCDPLETPPWYEARGKPISRSEIAAAIEAENLLSQRYGLVAVDWFRDHHVWRIAYLVVNGWKDAIEIDVGCPDLGLRVPWPVTEGNHRLAAAIYRGDMEILADVGGDVDYAFELFGVECAGEEAA